MTKVPGFLLEIDGEPVEITGVYEDFEDAVSSGFGGWIAGNGNYYGEDEDTPANQKVYCFKANKPLAFVSVYRDNPDGSRWGIRGIFRKGIWDHGENGMPLWKVWDRLA